MKRGGPLKRGKQLSHSKPLSSRAYFKPISDAQRKRVAEQRGTAEARLAFRMEIQGEACVVCGRTEAQAILATGYGHQAHHGIRQEVLKRLHLHAYLWDVRNAVCVCEEPCHRRHTSRLERIRRSELPYRVVEFAQSLGLKEALFREYPDF